MLELKNDPLEVQQPKAKLGFYQSVIDHVFRPMSLGRLTMILSDGNRLVYGNGDGGVEAVIHVKNNDFFKKCVLFGDVGFGESYVDGDWETESLTKVVEWMITNVEHNPVLMQDKKKRKPVNFFKIFNKIQFALRSNTKNGSRKNISDHYDLGNDFFKLFLDSSMTYSSAYFKNGNETLADAQANKYDALCQKLQINARDHVLEIGSGWGGFAVHAARNYGCKVTTITISKEQHVYASQKVRDAGLAGRVDVKLSDYRDVRGRFDKIVSIEMIEAVGHKFLKIFFQQCHALLKKDGLLGLQMITAPDHRYESFRKNVDWIQKHIFPGSLLPSLGIIQQSLRQTGNLMLHDYEDMTPSYAKTLALWREEFGRNTAQVKAMGFDEEFIRKWNYYKSYCEAAFKTRNISVVQAVFTRPNNPALN